MQKPTVMAFRKRMKKRGYKDIRIYESAWQYNVYDVSGVEPLAGTRVKTQVTIDEMHLAFRF